MVTELNSFQRQRKNKIILIIYSDLFFLYTLIAVQTRGYQIPGVFLL